MSAILSLANVESGPGSIPSNRGGALSALASPSQSDDPTPWACAKPGSPKARRENDACDLSRAEFDLFESPGGNSFAYLLLKEKVYDHKREESKTHYCKQRSNNRSAG